MSTTKIIKGYANPHTGPDVILWHEQQSPVGEHSPTKPATLYIGTGKLWTEDEVKKLVRDLREYLTETDFWQEDYDELLEGHGLTL